MSAVKPWVNVAEARRLTRRSARTLRRWRAEGLVRWHYDEDELTILMNTSDLLITSDTKSAYTTRPTFGR